MGRRGGGVSASGKSAPPSASRRRALPGLSPRAAILTQAPCAIALNGSSNESPGGGATAAAGTGGSAGGRLPAAVLTASDGCAAGVTPDRSGAVAREWLVEAGFEVVGSAVEPDEIEAIRDRVRGFLEAGARLVVTTGGTGLGPRDRTPEAVRPLLDREVPGYGELLRSEGLAETPMAVLARSFAGTVGAALVVVLPGSPRAVASGLRTLGPTIPHALRLLAGDTAHPPSGAGPVG